MPDHLELAKSTFNKAWEYLDRDDRTAEDDQNMLAHAAASWYHWRQVGEAKNLSVSDWQMSRVLAVLGSAGLSRSFAETCLQEATEGDLDAFYMGMAHEAVARAAALGGDSDVRDKHLAAAHEILEGLSDPEEADVLRDDLATIE